MTRRKSGPWSPRGRKAKGNQGELRVKRFLEQAGLAVLNGAMAEPGADLVLNPQAVVEVKNCAWASIGGVDRAALLVAAEGFRKRGIAHWLVVLEPAPRLCVIARRPNGRIGLVYEQPLAFEGARGTPLPPGFPNALGTQATQEEE